MVRVVLARIASQGWLLAPFGGHLEVHVGISATEKGTRSHPTLSTLKVWRLEGDSLVLDILVWTWMLRKHACTGNLHEAQEQKIWWQILQGQGTLWP